MSDRFRGIDNAAGFVLLCVAGGIGLFSWAHDTPAKPSVPAAVSNTAYTDSAPVEAAGNAAADAMEGAEDGADSAVPSPEVTRLEADKLRSTTAPQADDTVFVGGEAGDLRCQVAGSKPFSVKWQTNDSDGIVTVDAGHTRGVVTGEWAPAPNKIIYGIDVALAPPGVPQPFSIADDGTLTVDNGPSGTCTPTN